MAEESIFISVKTDGAYEELVKLKLGMTELREAQQSLDSQRKAGTVNTQEYVSATAKNTKAQDDQRKAIQSVSQDLKTLNSTQIDSKGSINSLRSSLGDLTKQYNSLSQAERESASGVEMKTKLKDTSNDLKGLEGNIGNYTRNVGDYFGKTTEALSGFFPEIGQAKDAFAQLTKIKELFGLATKASTVATTAEGIAAAGSTVTNTALGGSAIIAASGFDVLKLSLLSNPITLVALALVGVITYLTQFDGAMDGLIQAWDGVKAAGGPIIDIFGNLGRMVFTLGEIYLKPLFVAFEAISSLLSGDFTGALTTVSKGFDEFLGLFGQLSSQTSEFTAKANGLGSAMVTAASGAMALTKANQDLEDTQADLSFSMIETKKQIESLELVSANKAKTDGERLEAQVKANGLKAKLEADQTVVRKREVDLELRDILKGASYRAADWAEGQKFSKVKIKALYDQMAAMSKEGTLKGDWAKISTRLTNALIKEVDAEGSAKKTALEGEVSIGRLTKSIRADNESQQKENHDAFMQRKEEEKKATENSYATQATIAGLQVKIAKDDTERLKAESKVIQLKLDSDVRAAGKNKELIENLKAAAAVSQENLEKTYADKAKSNKDKEIKEATDREKEQADKKKTEADERLEALDKENKTALLIISERQAEGYINEEESNALKLEQEGIYLQSLLDLRIANGESTIEAKQNIANREIAIAKNKADTNKKIQDAELQTAKNILNIMSGVIDLALGNSSEAANFKKVAALGAIAIDTAIAIAGIVRIASTTSPDPITYGVQLTAGIASVLTNVANAIGIINSVNTPEAPTMGKARMGGLIGGNLHSNGGTLIEAERGEAILSRGAVSMFGPQLSQMNIAGGGQGFGASVDASRLKAQASIEQEYAMANAVKQMPTPIVNTRDIARTNRASTRVVSNSRI